MNKRKPKKPTSPYGFISFSPEGKVKKRMFQLSEEKEAQEEGVIKSFLTHFPSTLKKLEVYKYEHLQESDQDFSLSTNQGQLTIQLTEIVEKEYTIQITKEDYGSGEYTTFLVNDSKEIPLAVDETKRDNVIALAIQRKVEKRYAKAKNEVLWLVIFSTSAYIATVFKEGGKTKTSKAYETAVDYVSSEGGTIFDEIWYFNMITKPVRIWPRE